MNIGQPSLLNFTNEAAKINDGVYFNLLNNIWVTNFVMWYDDDARFRFNILTDQDINLCEVEE